MLELLIFSTLKRNYAGTSTEFHLLKPRDACLAPAWHATPWPSRVASSWMTESVLDARPPAERLSLSCSRGFSSPVTAPELNHQVVTLLTRHDLTAFFTPS